MDGKNRKLVKIVAILISVAVLIAAWIAFCGYQWSWGPFTSLHDLQTMKLPGNAERYALKNIQLQENSPITGKHIVFLGSSVTYGSASKGISFADYIAARNGCTITKEAVSGTTLVDEGINSYISRLNKLKNGLKADLFVCQLSTNDATQKKSLGAVSDSMDMADFDTKTVAGAIEYIISYAETTWNCPVMFYTNPQYDNAGYAQMVELLNRIAEKWDVTVIDMWNDPAFPEINEDQRSLYMADGIHPTQAGYLEWWTPYMEQVIYGVFADEEGT